MSVVTIDPQIGGVIEDGSPSGAVRTMPSAGSGVWVPVRNSRYLLENTGSTASFQDGSISYNPDGSNQALNISVPNTSAAGVRVWVPFVGRMFGVRWRRTTGTTPIFTVVVDGVAVAVSGQLDRLVAEGLTVSNMYDQGIAITHDNLDPLKQHYAEIIVTADVGGSARVLLLFGWVLDAMAGYPVPQRARFLISSIACPTSMTAVPQNSGVPETSVMGVDRLMYYNSSGGSLDVTVENGAGVTIWKKAVAAGGTETLEFGGITNYTGYLRHQASGAGVVVTTIGGY